MAYIDVIELKQHIHERFLREFLMEGLKGVEEETGMNPAPLVESMMQRYLKLNGPVKVDIDKDVACQLFRLHLSIPYEVIEDMTHD